VTSRVLRSGALGALLVLAESCAAGSGAAPGTSDAAIASFPDAGAPTDLTGVGGAAGPTDAGGAPAHPDGGGAATGARTCGALALCDDFEGPSAGGAPDPAKWTVGAPDLTGTGTLAIDDGQHHSGTRSVKVTGQGGYSNHIFLANAGVIGTLGPVIWGRFYLRLSDALGDGHVTFLSMADSAAGGKHLRMGGQSKILMWNRESDDATLPALSPAGIAASEPLPVGRWLCIEFMLDEHSGAMPASLQTWVDGAEVAGLHLDATPTPDVDEQWLREPSWRPALTSFALGWESYSGQAMTLWFDDVALDAARVGCL
jgi:polysaccharide lyase-like protein